MSGVNTERDSKTRKHISETIRITISENLKGIFKEIIKEDLTKTMSSLASITYSPILGYIASVDLESFLRTLQDRKIRVRQLIKRRPYELLEKAEKALALVREACNSRDADKFEDAVVLFAAYSRAAADASIAALMIWLLERIELALDAVGISSIMPRSPDEEKLGLLLRDASFKELRRIAVLFGQRDSEETLRKLEKCYTKLAGHPCWLLRNALSHGWPYQMSVEERAVIIPSAEKPITLDDMEDFVNTLKDYLKEVGKALGLQQDTP